MGGRDSTVNAMAFLQRSWLKPVGICLLLQAALLSGGRVFHGWLIPEERCCVSRLEL